MNIRIKEIETQISTLDTKIDNLREKKDALLGEREMIERNFATLTDPVTKTLKNNFEKAYPSLLAGDERSSVVASDMRVGSNPVNLECELRAEVNESAAEEIEDSIRIGDPYDEEYLEFDRSTYSIECATFVGIAALFPSGKVSIFSPFTRDTEMQMRGRAKRWRKKREGAKFFGYYFSHYVYDDDGAILESRNLTVYPI